MLNDELEDPAQVSRNENSEETSEFVETSVEAVKRNYIDPSKNVMPTLPINFKSLVGSSISIQDENKNAEELIRLLGSILGVDDYEKNMASFWFLDFIAYQLLRFENDIDDNEKSILVSWLAGEMKLIRDNKLSHENFLRHVRKIFDKTSEEISRGKAILHWNLLTKENSLKESNIEESITEEDSNNLTKEPEIPSPRIMRRSQSSKSRHRRISSKETSRHSVKSERLRIHTSESFNKQEAKPQEQNSRSKLLDVIIAATYDMYGDNFHYTLVKEAFIEPVELHDVDLPSVLRVPRPVKIYSGEKKGFEKTAGRRSKELQSQNQAINKKTRKERDLKTLDMAKKSETLVHVSEEEILKKNREFILPLMESNEAAAILENHKKVS